MRIVINASDERATEYVAVVHGQMLEGYSSGHHDADNNWESVSVESGINTSSLTEANQLMAAYIVLANTEGALAEESHAAWALILELAARAGIAIPTGSEAQATMDSLAENSKEIYSEEQVLAQERNIGA